MRHSQTSFIRSNKLLIPVLLLALVAFPLSLLLGAVRISPAELFRAVREGSSAGSVWRIICYVRLPRACASMLAGAGLAASGAVIQTVMNNPLASPHIIGVNAGAGLAVTILAAFLPTTVAVLWSPFAAFAGAMITVLLVMTIGEKTGASRMTITLTGVAISSFLTACIQAISQWVPDALGAYADFRSGGFSGVTMSRLAIPAVIIGVGLTVLLSLSGQMDILSLGQPTAQSLGLPVRRLRMMLLLIAAALAGASVSFAGLLGFTGLVVPHIIRRITDGSSRMLLIGSALGGAALVSLCDTLGRTLFAPGELPVGILLAMIGAPFFLWLLLRKGVGRHA